MAYICDSCGKGVQKGHNIRHKRGVAGGRWKRKAQKTKRVWLPNLHSVRIIEGGKVVRKRLCTKCLRRAERPKKVKKSEELKVETKKVDTKTEKKKEKKAVVKKKKKAEKRKEKKEVKKGKTDIEAELQEETESLTQELLEIIS